MLHHELSPELRPCGRQAPRRTDPEARALNPSSQVVSQLSSSASKDKASRVSPRSELSTGEKRDQALLTIGLDLQTSSLSGYVATEMESKRPEPWTKRARPQPAQAATANGDAANGGTANGVAAQGVPSGDPMSYYKYA